MTLPTELHRRTIETLINDVSSIDWPQDALRDVKLFTEVLGQPHLVEVARMMLRKAPQFRGRLGQGWGKSELQQLGCSAPGDARTILSRSGKFRLIPGEEVRRILLDNFKTAHDWYRHMLRRKLIATPMTLAVVEEYMSRLGPVTDTTKLIQDLSSFPTDDVNVLAKYIPLSSHAAPQITDVLMEKGSSVFWDITRLRFCAATSVSEQVAAMAELLDVLDGVPPEAFVDSQASTDLLPEEYYNRRHQATLVPTCKAMQTEVVAFIDGTLPFEDLKESAVACLSHYVNTAMKGISTDHCEGLLETLRQADCPDVFKHISVLANTLEMFQSHQLMPDIDYDLAGNEFCMQVSDCAFKKHMLSDIPKQWFPEGAFRFCRNAYLGESLYTFDLPEVEEILDLMTRFVDLSTALNCVGLAIREDSRMCQDYVVDADGDIEDIVAMMQEMEFFFKHTLYSTYSWSLREIGRHSAEDASETAKLAALHVYSGDIAPPQRFQGLPDNDCASAYAMVQELNSWKAENYENSCYKCGAWKDEDDYCSMCGTDSDCD
eukprot:jgi/Chrzof1/8096/UNPLg00141.t1